CDDVHAPPFAIEQDNSLRQCKQRVIAAAANVAAGVKMRAALPNNDTAGSDALTGVDLDAQALAVGFPTVTNRALTFLMCHLNLVVKSSARRFAFPKRQAAMVAFAFRASPALLPGRAPSVPSRSLPDKPIRQAARNGSRRCAGNSARPTA